MNKKELFKRWLVALLCVAMVVGSVPMPTEAAVILDSSNEAQDLLEVVDEDASTEATDGGSVNERRFRKTGNN